MTTIIDGRKIKDEILEEVKAGVLALPFAPVFCDILVGNDMSSIQYVKMKAKIAESVGIKFRSAEFPEETSTDELIEEIENLNKVPHICGVIIQLPLPNHIDKRKVLDAIDPKLDVDCLGITNSEKFYNNEGDIGFPTALACIKILDSLNINPDVLTTKNILVLGQGNLVGLPVTHLLKSRGLKVTTVNSKTENSNELIKNADIIVSAIGKAKHIKGEMIKEGVVIIDAGTSEDDGAVIGDVDLESVTGVASALSPTPGGVGPVTVAMLLKNVLQVAKNKVL
ncbi:MAG TPA: bifunctional 5,10-methylenetetrahydrofolate dehydrogenase/5,10-methenyltetrahydrofolate cyclohydrolase [Candidatus Paceibacterota bacterium]|nr:bifunctional 5,10-methylenetetrahydrofolate dehydrogenase/5,10-methenyltetrahydrofolate cyclohydrolase [Candidatus Paceibacterota bacterium]